MTIRQPVLTFTLRDEYKQTTTEHSYTAWSKVIIERAGFTYNEQGIQYLADIPNFGGYTYGTIGMYEGKSISTERHTINDIVELKEHLKNASGLVFISSLTYTPGIPYFYEMDENQEIFPVEGGINFTPPIWVVGYGILENQP